MDFVALLTLLIAVGAAGGGLRQYFRKSGWKGLLQAGGLTVALLLVTLPVWLLCRPYLQTLLGPANHGPNSTAPSSSPSNNVTQKDPGPSVLAHQLTTTAEMFRLIHADLNQLPEAKRSAQRYLTFTHLPTEQLECHRAALRAMVATFPADGGQPLLAVNEGETIFRLDLAAMQWDAGHWSRLLRACPYGLDFSADVADRDLASLARSVADLANVEQVAVRGDWFVVILTRTSLGQQLRSGRDVLLPPSASAAVADVEHFYDGDLTREQIAAELGLASVDELQTRLKAAATTPALELLSSNRPMQRHLWESPFGGPDSLYQAVARALGLAVPYR
jgi:hypothetical protein